jgi:antitoxin component of MazEF toxin-antitoxin module
MTGMIRMLTRQGDTLSLVIDRPLQEMLGIDANTRLKVSVDGRRLVVEPLPDAGREELFQKAMEVVDCEHAQAMRELAK